LTICRTRFARQAGHAGDHDPRGSLPVGLADRIVELSASLLADVRLRIRQRWGERAVYFRRRR
jgi:hypothetical protein